MDFFREGYVCKGVGVRFAGFISSFLKYSMEMK